MRFIAIVLIGLMGVMGLSGCAAPQPKEMPDTEANFLNDSFSSVNDDQATLLNSHDNKTWEVVYIFPLDNELPVLNPKNGYVDFMYHLQNSNSIIITSSSEKAIASFIRFSKVNHLTATVKYHLKESKSNLFRIETIKRKRP